MATTKIRGNTQIIDGTILNAQIGAAAAIATTKLADGAEFLKRNGSVALTGNLSGANLFTITDLPAPVAATDAVTKGYVDAIAQGLAPKTAARVTTTATITLSGAQTIDGIAVVAGDRVLVKDQTAGAANGLYVAAVGAWTRSTDADSAAELSSMFVFVQEGTLNADTGWVLSNDGVITLGTTALAYVQFSAAGVILAGAGLLKTGSTIDVVALNSSIVVAADSVSVGLHAAGAIAILGGAGIAVNYDASLAIAGNQLGLSAASAGNGLSLTAGVLNVGVDTNSFVSGANSISLASSVAGAALSLIGGVLAVKVTTGGGLEIQSGIDIKVKIDTAETVKSIVTGLTGVSINVAKFVKRQTPTGLVNGVNAVFTAASAVHSGTEEVYLNGILQESGGEDYTFSLTNTITFVSAPATGDRVKVSYIAA